MSKTKVTILGAGPAGLGAAWRLAAERKADVVVLEQNDVVGGNAGSFEVAGMPVDFGSHRLHPACDPKILADLKELLGNDLLDRPRHGRIRLQGRWIHFPLKPQDLMLNLPFSFSSGVAVDTFRKLIPHKNGNGHSDFATVLEKGLGKTICRDFYFPYAWKIWGVQPSELSAIQAHRRVSAGSLGKMAGKVLSIVPGMKKPGAGRFYYPREGYGQISTAIETRARELGCDIRLGSRVRMVELGSSRHRVTVDTNGQSETFETDHVWSTIPITALIRAVTPSAPKEVCDSCEKISYRAMVLIYLVLDEPQWTEFDAHYFPEAEIKITRLSEPRNYNSRSEPTGRTVLCAELPCSVGDEVWTSSDADLAALVRESLEKCDLPIRSEVLEFTTRRLPYAYPIYKEGYERYFEIQDQWVEGLDRVLTFGRQGLFAHDNTHHALAMAYGAVDCLDESGDFDSQRWRAYRTEFAKHVVED
ncbi:MAG TPA: FAD-dependent oxidoreductase [Pyrinomonadaceae bacterium]|nr:FAD-dependent oxidoreductase [Pyrinomonadaceae bacterium]